MLETERHECEASNAYREKIVEERDRALARIAELRGE
jgi:hypothetical protein